MQTLGAIDRQDQLAVLSDAHRLALLRRLMCAPSTLSRLGREFDRHPAWVRHHLKRLEASGLVEPAGERTTRNYTEKFYRATAGAFAVHLLIGPFTGERAPIVFLGSDDPALRLLTSGLNEASGGFEMVSSAVGSLDGLVALRQGLADVAGCHLFDTETGEFNTPYLRHLFPDRTLEVVTLAHREQGLMSVQGAGPRVRDVAGLAAGEVRLANRNSGSGTRVWLEQQLRASKIAGATIPGYEIELYTHDEVAEAVVSGRADVGLGVRAAAEARGLAFEPLFVERYDLVFAAERSEQEPFARLRDRLVSSAFRAQVRGLAGYDADRTGDGTRLAG